MSLDERSTRDVPACWLKRPEACHSIGWVDPTRPISLAETTRHVPARWLNRPEMCHSIGWVDPRRAISLAESTRGMPFYWLSRPDSCHLIGWFRSERAMWQAHLIQEASSLRLTGWVDSGSYIGLACRFDPKRDVISLDEPSLAKDFLLNELWFRNLRCHCSMLLGCWFIDASPDFVPSSWFCTEGMQSNLHIMNFWGPVRKSIITRILHNGVQYIIWNRDLQTSPL